MKSSIVPMSSVPAKLVEEYLVQGGIGRGLRRDVVRWKYFDEEFNRGRERGYVWFSKQHVRGFIGMIPVKVATPEGDRDMVWTCDWSVEKPESNPGIGVLLLRKVQKDHVFVAGLGGSSQTHSIVPRMRTRTVEDAAVSLRRPLRLGPLLESLERRLPLAPKLSRTGLKHLPLPRGSRPKGLPASEHSPGVSPSLAPLFDQPAASMCRVRYDAVHLAWLGRCPGVEFLSVGQGSAEGAGALLWRMSSEPENWRLVLRSSPGAHRMLEAVIADALDRLSRASAARVSTIVSSQDREVLRLLKRQTFIKGPERWPLYIPELEEGGAGSCREGFAQLSYLDTDLAFLT